MSASPIDELRALFLVRGDRRYGEATLQINHAIHCATLAEREGSPAWLVTAALTHDIGHLLRPEADPAELGNDDDRHEDVGARWLEGRFDPRVAQVVGAHVNARRYLCTTEPGYMRSLPVQCLRALALQGGPMCSADATRFDADALSNEALRLLRWDDRSLRSEVDGSRLEHFLSIARLAMRPALRTQA